ncbi:MAG: endo-1,4-beta-xylanase [Sphingobacteriia bacterium]|nr:endo-1,4-beta-xylanase [Sphingobacteriia bacterium]
MNLNIKTSLAATASIVLLLAVGCKKEPVNGITNTGNYSDTSGSIKSVASGNGFAFGLAADYSSMNGNSAYISTVQREASSITFGNELKYGSVVQNDGSFNFATADNFYNLCANANLQVFGHTLVWYQQQNATYLNAIVGGGSSTSVPNLIGNNAGFESGSLNWSIYNTNGATITFVTGDAANAHSGNGYMKVVNPTAQTGNQWKVQVSSATFTTTPGKQYTISYWVKAASAGGSIRLSTGPSAAQYQGDQTIGTAWQQVSWTITATLSSTSFLFDMGQVANTYYIDDVNVVDVAAANAAAAAASASAVANRVDSVMKLWINAAVGRYAGKIKAWDVVNEPMADGSGALRVSTNTSVAPGTTNVFFWSDYMGRDYALKAFQYAKAADPNALLFINDYNLESNSAKVDSLVAYITYLKGKGAQIDGIGTQLHTSIIGSYAGIDVMFQKLAATGLKIRISELDVKINPANKSNFSQVPVPATILASQADMYKYIVNSYMKNVPAAQRYGITVWGVNDNTSWLYNKGQDYPLLFDSTFKRKPAYSGVLQALKGQ